MLNHQYLACKLSTTRADQIKAKYWYGIEDCNSCSVDIEEYVHMLMFDKYISNCGFGISCHKKQGIGCPEPTLDTSCVDVAIQAQTPSGAIIIINRN
jgi:hypothetical protein